MPMTRQELEDHIEHIECLINSTDESRRALEYAKGGLEDAIGTIESQIETLQGEVQELEKDRDNYQDTLDSTDWDEDGNERQEETEPPKDPDVHKIEDQKALDFIHRHAVEQEMSKKSVLAFLNKGKV